MTFASSEFQIVIDLVKQNKTVELIFEIYKAEFFNKNICINDLYIKLSSMV